ncbi:MAG: alkaline phosphatase family protein [Pseudomonadota bacterium]
MNYAVLMVVDGLRGDMVTPEFVPSIASIAAQSRHFPKHRSVFPSATRVNSASIATGCYPGQHRLAGNAIALDEGEGLKPVSVGPPEFRERWRAATGRTLHRPTLSERLRDVGGVKTFTNSSAGAAHMQDPDGHGWLFHRSGSHGPGFSAVGSDNELNVQYDATGDVTTTERFVDAFLVDRETRSWTVWVCEPDHSQHALELGSPAHREILRGADARVAEVWGAIKQRRAAGDEVLFILCSDHGHETVTEVVPIVDQLVDAKLKADHESTDVVLASSGMGALVYVAEAAKERSAAIAEWLTAHASVGQVYAGDALRDVGQAPHGGIAIAFSMAKRDEVNRFGVRGLGAVAADIFSSSDQAGRGQHGGLGPYETNPMLVINGAGFAAGVSDVRSVAVDIAPTILQYLDVPFEGVDGRPLV